MKGFLSINKNLSSLYDARTKCEQYCAIEDECWGCSINCEYSCKWNAITDCGNTERWDGAIAGDISQKPGTMNNISFEKYK